MSLWLDIVHICTYKGGKGGAFCGCPASVHILSSLLIQSQLPIHSPHNRLSLSLESFHNVQYHIFVQNNKSSTLCLFLPHCHNSRSPKSHIKCSNAHTSIFNFHTSHPWPWTRHYWNEIVEIDDPVIPTSRISRCLQISTNCIILSDYLGLSPELWYLHHHSLDFWDCLESNKTFMTLLGLDDMPTNSYYWYN